MPNKRSSGSLVVLLCAAVLICPGACFAQSADVGTTTAKFLKIGIGDRAAGMGGAFAGIAEGSESIFWNPAGIANMKMREVGGGLNTWIEGITGQYMMVGYPFKGGKSALGFSYVSWNMGQIEVTSASTAIERYATVTQGYTGITYSFAFSPAFSFGATGKFIFQDLVVSSVNGGAADVGILVVPFESLRVGVSLQNFGIAQATGATPDALPWNVKVGTALCLKDYFIVALDADYSKDSSLKIHAGVEYTVKGEGPAALVLRFGYNQAEVTPAAGANNLSGLTFGFGFKGGADMEMNAAPLNLDVDYAYVPFAGFGSAHRIGAILKF